MNEYLTEREAADLLRLHMGTLANWRWMKMGPAHYKAGGRVLYKRLDLQHFLDKSRR